MRITYLVAACLAVPAVAQADVASNIQADLTNPASAVPVVGVTVGAPVGDAALAGPGQSVAITMSPPTGQPLLGILVPPGADPIYSTTSPQIGIWGLGAVEAVKHAVVSGSSFDSLTITNDYPGFPAPTAPEITLAVPPYQPPPAPPSIMSSADVKTRIQGALPAWASAASIAVVDDAAAERVITVSLVLPPDSFKIVDVGQLIETLEQQQVALQPQGANIGRVIAKISNPLNGDPLYTGGADAFVGFGTDWYSPLVAAFASVLGAFPDPLKTLATTADVVQQAGALP